MRWMIASVMLILVGCGGAQAPATPATSSTVPVTVPSEATSPAPTPSSATADDRAAVAAYSAAETTYLTTFRALGATRPPGTGIDARKTYYAAAAGIEDSYITALSQAKTILGPDRRTASGRLVAADVQALIDIHEGIRRLYIEWADPLHQPDILAEDHTIAVALDAEGQASMQVRSDLGLQR